MLDVIEIVLDFFFCTFGVCCVAMIYLCPTGNSRADDMAIAIVGDFVLKLFDKSGLFRSWANQAHVALEDIQKLR